MELDYKAIKALSAPTRIKILHRLLEKEATPTQLSDALGKSKSTISSHLSTLEEAGLVEKDKQEGRRRVTYAPTRKAQAIVEGRERTVRFSVASSVLAMVMGATVIGSAFRSAVPTYNTRSTGGDAETTAAPGGDTGTMDAPDDGSGDVGALDAPDTAEQDSTNMPSEAFEESENAPVEDTGEAARDVTSEAMNVLDAAVGTVTGEPVLSALGIVLLLGGIIMMVYGTILWWLNRSASADAQ